MHVITDGEIGMSVNLQLERRKVTVITSLLLQLVVEEMALVETHGNTKARNTECDA